ncbi:hypothetical protein [Candidatus Nitrospira salsa]|nr:MAG: hypothetical protein NPIRA01_29490 [Nitrospirales bacterium]
MPAEAYFRLDVDAVGFQHSFPAYLQMDNDDLLRQKVFQFLESGVPTEVEPRAYSSEDVQVIIARLQSLMDNQLDEKIKIAGFTLQPYHPFDDEDDLVQSCETCMYYLLHRRFCELPELSIPVEKDWSCRLWRI